MNWFKRLCMFVFGLSGLLALVALSLTWVGPWTTLARSYLELPWFFTTLEVLVCIAALGLLGCVLISLFAPRNPRETIVAQVPGGQITVTRAAISSQTKHVVEADGTCIASSVGVRVRKRGHVRVNVRVTPRRPVDVVECGSSLYSALEEGLARVCGDSVKSIDVVFTEPEQPEIVRPRVVASEDESHTGGSQEDKAITISMNVAAPEPAVATADEKPTDDLDDISDQPTSEIERASREETLAESVEEE